MASVMDIATKGLMAFQSSMATVGHNIANVNTPGYSRQVVELKTLNPEKSGGFSFGTGVYVSDVRRVYDNSVVSQVRNNTSMYNMLDTFQTNAKDIELLLTQGGTSVPDNLHNFFGAIQNANQSPDFIPSRTALLNKSEILVERYHNLSQQLLQQQQNVNSQLKTMVTNVTALAKNIRDYNEQLTGQANPPTDLLDQRDAALQALAKIVDVQVVPQSDGTVTVSVGTGQVLVAGTMAFELKTQRSPSDPQKVAIELVSSTFLVDITDNMVGGTIGGVIDFQREILDPTVKNIDLGVMGLVATFNAQHQKGVDMNGNLGGNFFTDLNTTTAMQGRVLLNTHNTGSLAMNVQIDDVSQLVPTEYQLLVNTGPSYTLINNTTDERVNFSTFPVQLDGFTLKSTGGAAQPGDSYTISPTRNAANAMGMALTDPRQIALASPITTNAAKTNAGSASIAAGDVVDISNASFSVPKQLNPPLRVEFLSGTSYQIVNALTSATIEGPIAYDPSTSNALFPTPGHVDPGYRISISGAAKTGDVFNVNYNTNGVGDNRNGFALGQIDDARILSDNSVTMTDLFSNLTAEIGSRNQQVGVNSDATLALLAQSQSRRDEISGVNLDEEAADLLRLQQAYQAASKLIQISSSMMDTLMSAVGAR